MWYFGEYGPTKSGLAVISEILITMIGASLLSILRIVLAASNAKISNHI